MQLLYSFPLLLYLGLSFINLKFLEKFHRVNDVWEGKNMFEHFLNAKLGKPSKNFVEVSNSKLFYFDHSKISYALATKNFWHKKHPKLSDGLPEDSISCCGLLLNITNLPGIGFG